MKGHSIHEFLFLKKNDSLANLINEKANLLFLSLKEFKSTSIEADSYTNYFINHHLGHRLYFSIESSAHILYESIKLSGKLPHEINAIDYGAGLGTLFMLGGMLGFKRFDYNDYFPEWKATATRVCEYSGIIIQDYIIGDITQVTSIAESRGIKYDIIVSRNVIEHIYDLQSFYKTIFTHNNNAIIYSTTTANYHNPAMNLYHIYIHKKAEKDFYKTQRINEIRKILPAISSDKLSGLAEDLRGKGQNDFKEGVNYFLEKREIIKHKHLRTNTCDCITGVWIEHLLKKSEYEHLIKDAGFKAKFTAGFWDTHYSYTLKNLFSTFLNSIISVLGKEKAVIISPFVNVVAYN